MTTHTPRRALIAAGLAACGIVLLAALPAGAAAPTDTPAATQTTPKPTPTGSAGEPWWVPVGLRGEAITQVTANNAQISVTASGQQLVSHDGGRTFIKGTGPTQPPLPLGVDAEVHSGSDRWALSAGKVLHAVGTGPLLPDPGAPDLGPHAHLLAAPAALPGSVVAVSDAEVVWWRDGATGSWGRALVLLPQSLFVGRPAITALSAFDQPISGGIYVSTDGYSVLLSSDGGEDWIRAGPGLPNSVFSLASDSSGQAVYAGTADGLWVHHLRAVPSIPVYTGADLFNRRVGTLVITLIAIGLGLLILRRGLRPEPSSA